MFNHFELITPPKREIFQAACLRWETWDTGREELSRHSGSLQGSDYLRSEYNFDTPKECLLFTKERKWRAGVVQGGKERYKTFLSYFFKCTL